MNSSRFPCSLCGREFSLRIQLLQHSKRKHGETTVAVVPNGGSATSSGNSDDSCSAATDVPKLHVEKAGSPQNTQETSDLISTNETSVRNEVLAEEDTRNIETERSSVIRWRGVVPLNSAGPETKESALLKAESSTDHRKFITARSSFACCLCPLKFHLVPDWFNHYEQCHWNKPELGSPTATTIQESEADKFAVELAEPEALTTEALQCFPDAGHITRMRCLLGSLRQKLLLCKFDELLAAKKEEELIKSAATDVPKPSLRRRIKRNHLRSTKHSKLSCTSSYEEHTRVQTAKEPLKCPYCSLKFSLRSSTYKHVRTMHPKEFPSFARGRKCESSNVISDANNNLSDNLSVIGCANEFNSIMPSCMDLNGQQPEAPFWREGVSKNLNCGAVIRQVTSYKCFVCCAIFKRSEALRCHMRVGHKIYGDVDLEMIKETTDDESAAVTHMASGTADADEIPHLIHSYSPDSVTTDSSNNVRAYGSGCEGHVEDKMSYASSSLKPSAINADKESQCPVILRSQSRTQWRQCDQLSEHLQPDCPTDLKVANIMEVHASAMGFPDVIVKDCDHEMRSTWEAVRRSTARKRRLSTKRTISISSSRGVYPKRCRHCPKWLFSLEAYKNHLKAHSVCPVGTKKWSMKLRSAERIVSPPIEINTVVSLKTTATPALQEAPRMQITATTALEPLNEEPATVKTAGSIASPLKEEKHSYPRMPAKVRCSHCPKYLSRRSIKAHEKSHTGVKPFMCPWCRRAFGRRDNLKTHVIKFHESTSVRKKKLKMQELRRQKQPTEDSYSCKVCSKSLPSRQALINHKKVHKTEQEVHICPHCDRKFRYQKNYRCHMLIMHDELPPPLDSRKSTSPEKAMPTAVVSPVERKLPEKELVTVKELMKPEVELPVMDEKPKSATKLSQTDSTNKEMQLLRLPSKRIVRMHPDAALVMKEETLEAETPYACLFCDSPFRRFEALKIHLKTWHHLAEEQADGVAAVIHFQHNLIQESERAKSGEVDHEL